MLKNGTIRVFFEASGGQMWLKYIVSISAYFWAIVRLTLLMTALRSTGRQAEVWR